VYKFKFLYPLIISFCVSFVAAAQTDCPAIVQAALNTVDAACADTARNQLCYGNISLTAIPRDGVSNLVFNTSGDLANVVDIRSLQLSSMSVTDESWGVALMRLQANLPDTLPGQNVTFLLFGDVQIEDESAGAPEVTLTTTRDVNVRVRPSTTTNNIMTSLPAGQTVVATGRLADGSWVRIKVEGDTRGVGWVSADFLEGDLDALAAIEPDAQSWGPMQAFYFQTGIGDRPCAEAPDSGILIQTPRGSGKVILNVNDVEIQLGSTVYLQAQPGNMMTVTVVEGQASLRAEGETQFVPAGTFSQVQLDETGKATGKPSLPQAYDEMALQTLPLNLDVFEAVEIAPPLTTAQINAAVQSPEAPPTTSAPDANGSTTNAAADITNGLPPSGTWSITETTLYAGCPPDSFNDPSANGSWTYLVPITFSGDRSTFTWSDRARTPPDSSNNPPITFVRSSESTYIAQVPQNWTVTFTSPTTLTSHYNTATDPAFGECRYESSLSGRFIR
jgi:hypothetical protein